MVRCVNDLTCSVSEQSFQSVGIVSVMLSDSWNNKLSLSVAKTSVFRDRNFHSHSCLKGLRCSHSTQFSEWTLSSAVSAFMLQLSICLICHVCHIHVWRWHNFPWINIQFCSPQPQLEMSLKVSLQISRGVVLTNADTQTQTVVTSLAASLPVSPLPSLQPLVRVCY